MKSGPSTEAHEEIALFNAGDESRIVTGSVVAHILVDLDLAVA
jgi:hypothetical protein